MSRAIRLSQRDWTSGDGRHAWTEAARRMSAGTAGCTATVDLRFGLVLQHELPVGFGLFGVGLGEVEDGGAETNFSNNAGKLQPSTLVVQKDKNSRLFPCEDFYDPFVKNSGLALRAMLTFQVYSRECH